MEKSRQIIGILLVSLLVGTFFAYNGQNSTPPERFFTVLATVQGTFLAIVVSVFLVSLQVNANEFSPLTIDEVGNSFTLTGLVLLYVMSIVIDLYFLNPITIQNTPEFIPQTWNYSTGIAVGVAMICLLSLIPARRVMASLVVPETVLQRAVKNIDRSVVAEDSEGDTLLDPEEIAEIRPNRSPFLIIEQVLFAAEERYDEYTVKQSIYHMYLAIEKVICPNGIRYMIRKAMLETGNPEPIIPDSHIDYEEVFEHWNRCIDVGLKGEPECLELLASTHSQLVQSLIERGQEEMITERLDEFNRILGTSFKKQIFKRELVSPYSNFVKLTLDNNMVDLITTIESSRFTICQQLASPSNKHTQYSEELAGERRDILETIVCSSIGTISTVAQHEDASKTELRQITDDIMEETNALLGKVLQELEASSSEQNAGLAVEQNLLSKIRTTLIDNLYDIHSADEVVGQNILKAIVELHIYQGKEANQLATTIDNDISEKEAIFSTLSDIHQEASETDFVRVYDSIGDVDKNEINKHLSRLENYSKTEPEL